MKKRAAPLTPRRVAEIGAKHAVWILISVATGGALVFYFTDAPTLVRNLAHLDASLAAWTCSRQMRLPRGPSLSPQPGISMRRVT